MSCIRRDGLERVEISETANVHDLREAIAEKLGVPYHGEGSAVGNGAESRGHAMYLRSVISGASSPRRLGPHGSHPVVRAPHADQQLSKDQGLLRASSRSWEFKDMLDDRALLSSLGLSNGALVFLRYS